MQQFIIDLLGLLFTFASDKTNQYETRSLPGA